MTVNPDRASNLTINVRIPGWARNEAVPGDLYRFLDKSSEAPALRINGNPVPLAIDKGYVSISRGWKRGDVIELTLPMPVRRVVASERVEADRGRVALQRGPIVYCAEWPDNPQGHVRNLVLPDNSNLTAEFNPELLGGVTVIQREIRCTVIRHRGKGNKPRAAIHRGAISRLGESRAGRDDGVDPE
jgi:DUF1680 family protein